MARDFLCAPLALLPEGWAQDVRLGIADGVIVHVETGVAARPGDRRLGESALLPAMGNLHSHAFQRALAGRTGQRVGEGDSFWTWRETMYRFLAVLEPEDVEAIAALAYMEMLEAGFAAVGEFHYLHHGPDGTPYDDPAEMIHRILAAARGTGIALTLLPVLYAHGGADGAPPGPNQRRFACDVEGFLRLHAAAAAALGPGERLGAAPHSLRAVRPDELHALLAALPEGPIHIHAAEQEREVAEVEAALGARPIAVLLDRFGIDPRWCVVHATHMDAAELSGLAASGAVAGLCPITEADLGDGIFPGTAYAAAGGRFGIGSDSNLRITVAGELALLEYGQRLRDRARNRLAPPGGSVGGFLYTGALAGGARALARPEPGLRAGAPADLVALDLADPTLAGLAARDLLDGWLFAGGERPVRSVWAAGREVVRDGRHVARDAIAARYRARMARIQARL